MVTDLQLSSHLEFWSFSEYLILLRYSIWSSTKSKVLVPRTLCRNLNVIFSQDRHFISRLFQCRSGTSNQQHNTALLQHRLIDLEWEYWGLPALEGSFLLLAWLATTQSHCSSHGSETANSLLCRQMLQWPWQRSEHCGYRCICFSE